MAILFLTALIWKSPDGKKEVARVDGGPGFFFLYYFYRPDEIIGRLLFVFGLFVLGRVGEGGGEALMPERG